MPIKNQEVAPNHFLSFSISFTLNATNNIKMTIFQSMGTQGKVHPNPKAITPMIISLIDFAFVIHSFLPWITSNSYRITSYLF